MLGAFALQASGPLPNRVKFSGGRSERRYARSVLLAPASAVDHRE